MAYHYRYRTTKNIYQELIKKVENKEKIILTWFYLHQIPSFQTLGIGGPVYVVISQYKWLFIDINLENIKFFYA